MDTPHGHDDLTVLAGRFKQQCPALLDRVAETGTPIGVTKGGRPVARVVPIDASIPVIEGSLRVLTDDEEELYHRRALERRLTSSSHLSRAPASYEGAAALISTSQVDGVSTTHRTEADCASPQER